MNKSAMDTINASLFSLFSKANEASFWVCVCVCSCSGLVLSRACVDMNDHTEQNASSSAHSHQPGRCGTGGVRLLRTIKKRRGPAIEHSAYHHLWRHNDVENTRAVADCCRSTIQPITSSPGFTRWQHRTDRAKTHPSK